MVINLLLINLETYPLNPNINKSFYLLCCILFLCPRLTGQLINIKGKLIDKENNRSIDGAIVLVNPGKLNTVSNQNGDFSFQCTPGGKEISIKVLGYKPTSLSFNAQSDSTIKIFLQVSPFEINEVRITGDSVKSIEISDHGSYILTPATIYENPKHFSEPDLIKSLQLLPGVVAGRDGTTDIFVRGGNAGQNIVLANGCYFFLPSHLLGIVSPYDLDFIEKSELIKDYFPAELGGGASSILRLDYHKQKSDSVRMQLRLGLLSSGIILKIPLKKINWGLTGGLKRGNYSLYAPLLKRILNKNVGDFLPPNSYSFYDAYLRLTHSSTKWGDLSYLFIGNSDNGEEGNKKSINSGDTLLVTTTGLTTGWNNKVHSIQWTLPFRGNLKWRYDLNFNKISMNRNIYLQSEKYLNNTELYESNKSSYSFFPTVHNLSSTILITNNNIKIGYSAGFYYRLRYFSPNVSATDIINETKRTNEFSGHYFISEPAAFFSTKILLINKIQLNGGLRFSGGFTNDTRFIIIEPRLRLALNPGKKVSPHINYVRLSQFDHSLEGSSAGLRSMLWLPISKDFGPEISDVLSAGVQGQINNSYIFVVDGYYKKISEMVDFKPGASFLYNTSFDDLLEKIKVNAFGLETFLIKRTGKFTGSLSYTYSRSKREWGTPAGLIWIPSNADRPHSANITMKYYMTEKLSVGLNWIFISGSPATIYIHETFYGKWFETKNNIRYPDYHRLDLSMRRTFTLNKFFINLEFDVCNVYNRKNTFYLQEAYDENRKTFIYRNVSLFPVMPSLTLTIKY